MKPKEAFNPYSITLEVTSEQNFYYAKSSNGWDIYGLYFTGPDAVLCSCPAGSVLRPCKHRAALLSRYNYVTELDEMTDEEWQAVKARIETFEELEAVKELFGNEAA